MIEWIPTVKMETTQPVEASFGNEFQSIIAELWQSEVAIRWKNFDLFFAFFGGKRPFIGKFSKLCFAKTYRDTAGCVVFIFRETWPTEICKVKSYVYGARSKMNPIYGWSLASSRRNSDLVYTGFPVNVRCEELWTVSWLSVLFRFFFGAAAHRHRFTCMMPRLIFAEDYLRITNIYTKSVEC